MIEDVRPSVVRIRTDKGSGSGVIFEVDDDAALVLTNYHVIEDASDTQVEVNDSSTYSAELLGTDSVRDLAVLRDLLRRLPRPFIRKRIRTQAW